MRVGKELDQDPEFLRRCAKGEFKTDREYQRKAFDTRKAVLSLIIFLTATAAIILFGSIQSLRPLFDGKPLQMSSIIEILMLSAAALILLVTRTDGMKKKIIGLLMAGVVAVTSLPSCTNLDEDVYDKLPADSFGNTMTEVNALVGTVNNSLREYFPSNYFYLSECSGSMQTKYLLM